MDLVDIVTITFVVGLVIGIIWIPKWVRPTKGQKKDPPDSNSFGSLDGR